MKHLQSSQHIPRRDIVHPDPSPSPLNRQTRGQMPHRRLRRIVWRLRLWHIDNSARHTANEDNTAWCLALHEMLGHTCSEQVCAVYIDTPQFLHTIVRVVNCLVILSEACGGDENVDFAMGFEDGFEAVFY